MEVDDEDEDDELQEDELDEDELDQDDRLLLLDKRVSLDSFLPAFFHSTSVNSLDDALFPPKRSFD